MFWAASLASLGIWPVFDKAVPPQKALAVLEGLDVLQPSTQTGQCAVPAGESAGSWRTFGTAHCSFQKEKHEHYQYLPV